MRLLVCSRCNSTGNSAYIIISIGMYEYMFNMVNLSKNTNIMSIFTIERWTSK